MIKIYIIEAKLSLLLLIFILMNGMKLSGQSFVKKMGAGFKGSVACSFVGSAGNVYNS